MNERLCRAVVIAAVLLMPASGFASCSDVMAALGAASAQELNTKLQTALRTARNTPNGGFNLDMWGALVDRDGIVCAVAFTSTRPNTDPVVPARGDQWPGSRVISMQKANTANSFSLPGLALSTANLYTAVQPGGTLF